MLIPKRDFHLLKRDVALATDRFNTGMAQHHFCEDCGVKSFYVPRSHPNGFSINVNCVDEETLGEVRIRRHDGRDRQRNIAQLSPISD